VKRSYTPWYAWIITLLLPVALVLTAVRLLITPLYLQIAYNMPGFPPDPYGFTKTERLYWANIAAQYLLNDADISFLAELRFPAGQTAPEVSCRLMDDCTRLYNPRELKHLQDVKAVVQRALQVWLGSLALLAAGGIWAYFGGWRREYLRALRRGGWLTLGLLGGITLFVLLAFGVIFVAFHNVFFAPGTWTFFYSDTLIRLFPERFWRDTFLAVALLAGGTGALIALLLRERTTRD